MSEQIVSAQELLERFEELLDFVNADEDGANQVVIVRPEGGSVMLVSHGAYVAQRLALRTYQSAARAASR